MSNLKLKYEIRDPIHGFIHFNEWEKTIIDHPVFQRLRRIRQNSLTDMVYPGMTHTRFEHSIGVMKLADDMFNSIIKDEKSRKTLDGWGIPFEHKDRLHQMIRIAALVHDIGHAPFSHVSEEIMPFNSKSRRKYKHEDYTIALIKGPLKDVIEGHKGNKPFNITVKEISAFFDGDSLKSRELFWRQMISSQLDADRGDYLQRDSYYGGVKYGIYDLDRLLNTLTIGLDPESESPILGSKEEGWQVAESFILARYRMFTQVYFHKTRRAYDKMLQEAISQTFGTLPDPSETDEYIGLNDHKLWCKMEQDKDNNWFKDIIKRKHIRKVFSTNSDYSHDDLEDIVRILADENIWYWVDSLEKLWYNPDIDKEIMLFRKDGGPIILSKKSKIIASMESYNSERIYVEFKDREKVNKLIRRCMI